MRSTRAESVNTIPSWASARIQNTARFPKTAAIKAGELETNHAVTAVISRPPHIHPYTPRMKPARTSASRYLGSVCSNRSGVGIVLPPGGIVPASLTRRKCPLAGFTCPAYGREDVDGGVGGGIARP